MGKGMALKLKLIIAGVCVASLGVVCALVFALMPNNKITINYVLDAKKYSEQYEKGVLVEQIKLPKIKDGYYFDGWFEDAEYSHKLPGETQIKESKTLFPKVLPKDAYTLIYCANNRSNQIAIENHKFDSTITARENSWTNQNYEFVGWSEQKDALYNDVDAIILQEAEIEMQSAIKTLYAIWRGRELNVTYDFSTMLVDGEPIEYSDLTFNYGDEFTLPNLDYVTHFEDGSLNFGGFLVNGVVYENGATVALTSSSDVVTITPNWIDGAKLYVNIQNPENEELVQYSFAGDSLLPHTYNFASMTDTESAKTLSEILNEMELSHYTFKGFGTMSSATHNLNSVFETNKDVVIFNAIFSGVQRKIDIYNGEERIQEHLLYYGQDFVLPYCECGVDVLFGYSTQDYEGEKPQYSGEITINFEDYLTNLYADFKQIS